MAHLSRVNTGSLWEWGQDHTGSGSESLLELFLYRPHLQLRLFSDLALSSLELNYC